MRLYTQHVFIMSTYRNAATSSPFVWLLLRVAQWEGVCVCVWAGHGSLAPGRG